MAKAVMTAPDPVVQIKTAADFVKKYPKSTLRPRLARELAQKIDGATDPAQKVNGAQAYREIFTEPYRAGNDHADSGRRTHTIQTHR